LVTGCAGFIGYHLCRKLLDKGFEVYGIDNLSRGLKERVNELANLGLKFHRGDVRDYNFINDIVSKVDVVVHLAALISVEESFKEPILYNDVNVNGTINLVLASIRNKVKSIIYASSAAVYGNPLCLPIDENHPLNPLSPYGVSKLAGEYYVKLLSERHDLRYVILRLFNVYGPGQVVNEYAGVIVKFIDRVSRNLPPIIYGDGKQTRDFVYVGDVVEAFIKAIELDVKGVFNIASGTEVSINELAKTILKLFNREHLGVEYAPPRPGDIRFSVADISKAVRVLKWSPRTGLREGLLECIRYFMEKKGLSLS